MKKLSISLLTVLLFFMVACSPNSTGITVYEENDTLRTYIKNKESQILWTKALNEKALTYDIAVIEGISDTSNCTLDGLKTLRNFSAPVYPYLKDFAKLDLAELPVDQLNFTNEIVETLLKGFDFSLAPFFQESYIFNCVFFMEDYRAAIQELFSTDKKVLNRISRKENNESSENEEIENLFSKYYVGQPAIGYNITQVPVRLVSKYGYIDLELLLSTENEIKLIKIDIIKMEKYND